MGFAPQSSTLLGSALSVAFVGAALLAYTPDLQAGQKSQLERQVDALQRENQALLERLDTLEGSMLAAAPKEARRPTSGSKTRKKTRKARKPSGSSKSKTHPGDQTSNPQPPPKSALEAEMEFRAKVRKALKKELAQLGGLDSDVADLQNDVGALKTHTHEISVPGRSPRAFIAKHAWDVISDDAMIPYVPPESIGKGVADKTFTTTAPK